MERGVERMVRTLTEENGGWSFRRSNVTTKVWGKLLARFGDISECKQRLASLILSLLDLYSMTSIILGVITS